jgi:uncharacterized protein YjdB
MKRIATIAALALAACGPKVKTVTVEPAAAPVLDAKGATYTFRAVPRDEKNRPVTEGQIKVAWSSSAPAIVTVDEAGKVTAQKSGEAVITAAVGEAKGSARIAVSIPSAVTVAPAAVELRGRGQTAMLDAKVTDDSGKPVTAPGAVLWTTSDPAIAMVSNGQVFAVGPGTATVKAAVGALAGQAEVTVKLPEFATLQLKPGKVALAKAGATARIQVTALDKKKKPVPGVTVAWKTSNPKVVRVGPDGTVTAVKKGKAKVTASAGGKSASADVTVKK